VRALKPHARTLILQLASDLKLSSAPQPADQAMPSATRRVAWAILIAITLYVCYFSNLGVIGFVGPDEPRYAWIARDMAETGDWVTPRLYGRPWFEKPPLLYWGGAIFFKLLGEDYPEVAARLPSAISALLATLALAWLAWRTYGEECARWLLLLLPTSVGMIGFSHACATDMPFTGMLTFALVCAAVILGLVPPNDNTPILPRAPWLALLLFGFFLGLAVLAKGPAALILSGGAVFFWALFTKRWRDAFRLFHPAAIVSFCVTAVPWYIVCARRNPDFFRIFIIEHNFKRYLTPEFQHIQPFWFYIPVLLLAFLPWTLLLLFIGFAGLRQFWRARRVGVVSGLALSWSVFCLLFFTASKSKLPGYILPAIPAVALLLAHTTTGTLWFSRKVAAWVLFLQGFVYLSVILWTRLSERETTFRGHSSWAIKLFVFLTFGLFAFSSLFAGVSLWTKKRSLLQISFTAASILAIALVIGFLPRALSETHYDLLSGKEVWRALPREARLSPKLRAFGFRRDYRYALNFYMRREILDWSEDEIQDGFVVTDARRCKDLNTQSNCRDLWENFDTVTNWSLLKLRRADSLGGIESGGQPKQEK
jgi:4-amino-4-deoxy-L-arabinose transferase-like glycosyltransferase